MNKTEPSKDDLKLIAFNSYDDFSKFSAKKILELYEQIDSLQARLTEGEALILEGIALMDEKDARIKSLQKEDEHRVKTIKNILSEWIEERKKPDDPNFPMYGYYVETRIAAYSEVLQLLGRITLNIHVAAFGKISEEQKSMVDRAIAIDKEEQELYLEKQKINVTLRSQGVNMWDEIRYRKEKINKKMTKLQRDKLYAKRDKHLLLLGELAAVLNVSAGQLIDAQMGNVITDEVYNAVINWLEGDK
jgi:hypothetical protein